MNAYSEAVAHAPEIVSPSVVNLQISDGTYNENPVASIDYLQRLLSEEQVGEIAKLTVADWQSML